MVEVKDFLGRKIVHRQQVYVIRQGGYVDDLKGGTKMLVLWVEHVTTKEIKVIGFESENEFHISLVV